MVISNSHPFKGGADLSAATVRGGCPLLPPPLNSDKKIAANARMDLTYRKLVQWLQWLQWEISPADEIKWKLALRAKLYGPKDYC